MYGQGIVPTRRGPAGTTQFVEMVYAELHRLAMRYLRRERPNHTLQPTALINEAYLHLIEQKHIQWQDRGHFLGTAAQMMRRVLREHARRRHAFKRQGDPLLIEDSVTMSDRREVDALDLERALDGLAKRDAVLARVVELRFFGGLTVEEAGEVLGISSATVKRHWTTAKAYMWRELRGGRLQ